MFDAYTTSKVNYCKTFLYVNCSKLKKEGMCVGEFIQV